MKEKKQKINYFFIGAGSATVVSIGLIQAQHYICSYVVPYSYRYSIKATLGYIFNIRSWNELI